LFGCDAAKIDIGFETIDREREREREGEREREEISSVADLT